MNKSRKIWTRSDQILHNSRQIIRERAAAEADDKLQENLQRSTRCRTVSRRLQFDQVYTVCPRKSDNTKRLTLISANLHCVAHN